jgi:hypothetical protein
MALMNGRRAHYDVLVIWHVDLRLHAPFRDYISQLHCIGRGKNQYVTERRICE